MSLWCIRPCPAIDRAAGFIVLGVPVVWVPTMARPPGSSSLMMMAPNGRPTIFATRFCTLLFGPSALRETRPYNDIPGNHIEDKFWSLHCFRRGARSQVSWGGLYGKYRFRKATKDEVYEHGRWRRLPSHEQIDVMYREWTLFDRLQLTFYCH
jgi:hypothetical protein